MTATSASVSDAWDYTGVEIPMPSKKLRNMFYGGNVMTDRALIHYKTVPCDQKSYHDFNRCPFYHACRPGEMRRRSLATCAYDGSMCRTPKCTDTSCGHAHNTLETLYHPSNYKRRVCDNCHIDDDGKVVNNCPRVFCSFRHPGDEPYLATLAKSLTRLLHVSAGLVEDAGSETSVPDCDDSTSDGVHDSTRSLSGTSSLSQDSNSSSSTASLGLANAPEPAPTPAPTSQLQTLLTPPADPALQRWADDVLATGEALQALVETPSPTFTGNHARALRALWALRASKDAAQTRTLLHGLVTFAPDAIIGEGRYGTVHLGLTRYGQPVAVKIVRHRTMDGEKRVVAELELTNAMRTVGVPHTCAFMFYDVRETATRCEHFYVFELRAGSLSDCLDGWRQGGPDFVGSRNHLAAVAFILGHLLEAVRALHGAERPLVHGDIKPENILLDSSGGLALSDFGGSVGVASAGASTRRTSVVGTASYMPPELRRVDDARGFRVTQAADVYAVGRVACDMLLPTPLGNAAMAYLRRGSEIQGFLGKAATLIFGRCDRELRFRWIEVFCLISDLTRSAPERRPTAAEARTHPLFWSVAQHQRFVALAGNTPRIVRAGPMNPPELRRVFRHSGKQPDAHWATLLPKRAEAYMRYEDTPRKALRVCRNIIDHYGEHEMDRDTLRTFPMKQFPNMVMATLDTVRAVAPDLALDRSESVLDIATCERIYGLAAH